MSAHFVSQDDLKVMGSGPWYHHPTCPEALEALEASNFSTCCELVRIVAPLALSWSLGHSKHSALPCPVESVECCCGTEYSMCFYQGPLPAAEISGQIMDQGIH